MLTAGLILSLGISAHLENVTQFVNLTEIRFFFSSGLEQGRFGDSSLKSELQMKSKLSCKPGEHDTYRDFVSTYAFRVLVEQFCLPPATSPHPKGIYY